MDQRELLASIRSLLDYHRACGIESYPGSEEMLQQLNRCCTAPAPRGDASVLENKTSAGGRAGAAPVLAEPHNGAGNPAALKREIEACRSCFLHRTRLTTTAGEGGSRPKLMVVGDWLSFSGTVSPEPGSVFGRDQDRMLSRMISAINLKEDEVFITNVIKCSIPDNVQPNSEHIETCSAWLSRQIQLLKPVLICSMGIISSRLLTGCSQPLSRQRGHFAVYRTPDKEEIPVMPTYHPTFLLQNPEMKQEAWSDLQEIEKKIAQAGTGIRRAR